MARRRSTVVLVAERAGVSIASVSRVLNGLPASDDVRARVEAAASELSYVPDAVARSLKVGRTDQLAFAVPDVGNPAYVAMMRAVAPVIGAAGYRLVMSSTGNDPEAQLQVLESLDQGYADGLILVPLRISDELVERLSTTRLPVVVVGTLPDHVPVDNVRAASPAGIDLAVAHLVDAGRRRIAFVNGPLETVPGTARLAGYLAALDRRGLTTSAELQVEAADFTFEAGLTAAAELLGQSSPDAVLCANDLLAVAASKVIVARGLDVPDDVSVVGIDDSSLAVLATPALTSVNLGAATRAATAAGLLLDRLADPDTAAQRVTVDSTLTVRQSSVPIDKAAAS